MFVSPRAPFDWIDLQLVETEDRIMLVMEYANGGELSRFWVFCVLCSFLSNLYH
jgi:hypothetical protein